MVQVARLVEAAVTEYIVGRTREAGLGEYEITKYRKKTLGGKLTSWKVPDTRKLDTHLMGKPGWGRIHDELVCIKDILDRVLHYAEHSTRREAMDAIDAARAFFTLL